MLLFDILYLLYIVMIILSLGNYLTLLVEGVNCLDIPLQIQKVLDIRHYGIRPCGKTPDPWGSVHLSSYHHGSHWECVGDTEEDWEQTHCGPRQVSQLTEGGITGAFYLQLSLLFWL